MHAATLLATLAVFGADSTRIDNPWWPMRPGTRWVYRETERGHTQRVAVTVTHRVKRVAGIDAVVVHDLVTERGRWVESTYDWYAQDRAGTVWYMGEDTTEYEDGRAVSKEGSWEAGVDGAQAGIVMPARPRVGMRYRQEHAPGEAEDRARVLSLHEQAQVPFGHFTRVLMTKDFTPLEPRVLEYKLYARGVGPVLVLGASGGAGREELVRFSRGAR
jgi:NADPH:quinone reductase-like Zn-dependent oxidoreductase